MRSVIPSPQAPISNWCLKGHAPGDLDNIISEPLRPDLILASYPTIHYVNPCLLIQGQLRAVAGDMWSPSGSDVSSANVWLNHPQGRRGCQQDTARLTSELPVTLSPSTGTHTHTHTHARHKWQTVHLNVPVRSSIAISLTHSMKTDDDSRIGKYGCDQLNLIFMSLSLLSSWLILNGSALITNPYNLLRFKWKVNLKFKESLFQRLFSSMMKYAMMSAYNNILTLSQSSSPCFIFVVFRH